MYARAMVHFVCTLVLVAATSSNADAQRSASESQVCLELRVGSERQKIENWGFAPGSWVDVKDAVEVNVRVDPIQKKYLYVGAFRERMCARRLYPHLARAEQPAQELWLGRPRFDGAYRVVEPGKLSFVAVASAKRLTDEELSAQLRATMASCWQPNSTRRRGSYSLSAMDGDVEPDGGQDDSTKQVPQSQNNQQETQEAQTTNSEVSKPEIKKPPHDPEEPPPIKTPPIKLPAKSGQSKSAFHGARSCNDGKKPLIVLFKLDIKDKN